MSHATNPRQFKSHVCCRVCAQAAPAGVGATWEESRIWAERWAEQLSFTLVHMPHLSCAAIWLCGKCKSSLRGALVGRRVA